MREGKQNIMAIFIGGAFVHLAIIIEPLPALALMVMCISVAMVFTVGPKTVAECVLLYG